MKNSKDQFINGLISLNFFLISCFICLACFSSLGSFGQNRPVSDSDQWKLVDSLERQGLPKSQLDLVNQIYKSSVKNADKVNLLKSIIYIIKINQNIYPDTLPGMIGWARTNLTYLDISGQAVLNSMLAEMYWQYYSQNSWQIRQQTHIEQKSSDNDLKTWDYLQILDTVRHLYLQSVTPAKKLQQIPVSQFYNLIEPGSADSKERPTLYDFLINRALTYFAQEEPTVDLPQSEFNFGNKNPFVPASEFIKNRYFDDTINHPQANVTRLFQQWIEFWMKEGFNTEALFYADLKRLQFYSTVYPDGEYLYETALKQLISEYHQAHLKADVQLVLANLYYEWSGRYKRTDSATFQYKNYRIKAHELCIQVISEKPGLKPETEAQKLMDAIEHPSLEFELPEVVCPKTTKPVKLTFMNVEKVYVKLVKTSRAELERLQNARYEQEEYLKLMGKNALILDKTISLPRASDFLPLSTEILLDGMDAGTYVLFMSNHPGFVQDTDMIVYHPLVISNIAYAVRNQIGSIEFYVMNRTTGQALENIKADTKVRANRNNWRDRTMVNGDSFYSDKQGFISIAKNNDLYTRGFNVIFSQNGDTLQTSMDFSIWGQENTDGDEQTQYRTLLFTDRAIYRPGQIVWFKGILVSKLKDENKLEVGFSTEVKLYDANYQEISKLKVKTNEFGSFSGSFVLPIGGLNGEMSLTNDYGSLSFRVEEYKRPTFEVKLEKPTNQFRLGDSVTITGKAIGYNGVPVAGAKVKYHIDRTPQWFCWWMPYQKPKTIDFGQVITNGDGTFTIRFKLEAGQQKPKSYEQFRYNLTADVTNSAGETRSESSGIIAGGKALLLSVEIPDKIVQTEPESWKINIKNNEGLPVKSQVKIAIEKLVSPEKPLIPRQWENPDTLIYSPDQYKKAFNDYSFNQESDFSEFKVQKKVYENAMTVDGSADVLPTDIGKWEPGIYHIKVSGKDAFGQLVQTEQYFTLYNPHDKKVPFPQWVWYTGGVEQLEPGQKATIKIGSSQKVYALILVEFNGKILQQQNLEINQEIKTFSFPVTENLRGGFAIHTLIVTHGKLYEYTQVINVPFTNKELKLSWATFRDKLQPGQNETWQLTIEGSKGEKKAAELLATMYDASLDAFVPHQWSFDIFNSYWYGSYWNTPQYGTNEGNSIFPAMRNYPEYNEKTYGYLNWFGLYWHEGEEVFLMVEDADRDNMARPAPMRMQALGKNEMSVSGDADFKIRGKATMQDSSPVLYETAVTTSDESSKEHAKIQPRTNFNETSFFYPQLQTDSAGKVTISFTLPQSLTRWKFKALAHRADLSSGKIEQEIIAQKELMVEAQAPRFVVQGDRLVLPVKIQNMTERTLSGKVQIELSDVISGTILNLVNKDSLVQSFSCKPWSTEIVRYEFSVPDTLTSLQYKVTASTGEFTDGEQRWLPVLSRRVLVVETMPLWVNGNQNKTFELKKLTGNVSTTLKQHQLTLEMTANPSWYAIQSLPYLAKPTSACIEQQFNAFYANCISGWIVQKYPAIGEMFKHWQQSGNKETFLSALEKNPELKQTILNETPWVTDALSEKEQKQRMALLFEINQLAQSQKEFYYTLKKAQLGNGAWPWFPGMNDSRYITQYIVSGIGHLKHLGILNESESELTELSQNAISYLDNEIVNDYNDYLEQNKKHPYKDEITSMQIQYLYLRSFFPELEMDQNVKDAVFHYAKIGKEQWLKQPKFLQAQLALFFFRNHDLELAKKITSSIKQFAIQSEEMGMYWKENITGYQWYQAPVEFQSLMIELFNEIEPNTAITEALQVWLLKNRQTNSWKGSKATAEAIYAMLINGSGWMDEKPELKIQVGNKTLESKDIATQSEPGTGYFKESWKAGEISNDMGKVTISRQGKGISWGGLYWQYFEDLDKVSSASTSLSIQKELFIETYTPSGLAMHPVNEKSKLKVGDRLVVKLTVKTDRALEYVSLKDNRPACCEPVDVLSGYIFKFGLGYYTETRDVATNYYFDRLPAGTWQFEYRMDITNGGDYAIGIAQVQCMYAPEFAAHSKGMRLIVDM